MELVKLGAYTTLSILGDAQHSTKLMFPQPERYRARVGTELPPDIGYVNVRL